MRKHFFTLLIITPLTIFGQSWTSSKGGDTFDGTYKTCSVEGRGTEYPYKSPRLSINIFDNEKNDINFYISGAGFFQNNSGLSIMWVFDNEPNTIYSSYSWSISNDGKIIFFDEFNNPDENATKLEKIDIISKLTKANKVSIRVSDDYGQNDLTFSLSGSTRAINFVIPPSESESLLNIAKEKRNKALDEINNKGILLDNLIGKLNYEMIEENSLKQLKEKIKEDLGLGNYSFSMVENVKDIEVVGNVSSFESRRKVDVFYVKDDGSKSKIFGDWYVLEGAPVYARNEEIKETVKSLLIKYKYEKLITHLTDEVLKQAKGYKGFPISSINEVKIILSKFQYGKFWSCKLNIYLNDGSVITKKDTYIYSSGNVEISKSRLKSIGGKDGIEF